MLSNPTDELVLDFKEFGRLSWTLADGRVNKSAFDRSWEMDSPDCSVVFRGVDRVLDIGCA